MRQFCHDVTSLTTLSLDSCEGESELWTRCKPDDLIGVSNLAEANAICDVKKLFKSIYDGCESRRQIEQDSQLYQILFGAIATACILFVMLACIRGNCRKDSGNRQRLIGREDVNYRTLNNDNHTLNNENNGSNIENASSSTDDKNKAKYSEQTDEEVAYNEEVTNAIDNNCL